MSKRKAQNSFLFITTLGVYLGLVLVGTTPVLGHVATTRNFEISEEIEIKDDLDRKPDDKRVPIVMSVGNYYADLEIFLDTLKKLRRGGQFDLTVDTFEVSQSTALPCVAGNNVGSYTAETFFYKNAALKPSLESAEKRFTDGYAFADCVPSERFSGQEATHSRFVLKLTDEGLSLEISGVKRSPAEAEAYLRDLTSVWDRFRLEYKLPVQKYISDGTTLGTSGRKILVVTRLPRAALIKLLATDA